MALALDELWSKARTIEIYLNIAEWGDGLYGNEAAAQRSATSTRRRSIRARARCLQPRCRTRSSAIPRVRPRFRAASPPPSKLGPLTAPTGSVARRDSLPPPVYSRSGTGTLNPFSVVDTKL